MVFGVALHGRVMPELAEVEFFRKQWDAGRVGRILSVALHPVARVFREERSVEPLQRHLPGKRLLGSSARGKWMLFRFSGGNWLGVHLGMTGRMTAEPASLEPGKADHLVLFQSRRALVFRDTRQFGCIRFHRGPEEPSWWREMPPDLLSREFTREVMAEFLRCRGRAPVKSVLLMQERFPGLGNWMADEILWRSGIHPAVKAGSIRGKRLDALFREIRAVCRGALETIGVDYRDPPDGWLFHHRWRDGGVCPATGVPLERESIGGRTTCWSPEKQRR